MDWKGLLNWSLKYNDGTVDKGLKPMSEEDMKFLEAAFESVCMNEMKEIMKILDLLKSPEPESEDEIQNRLDMLDDLQILVDGPENSRNIVRSKRFPELVNYFFTTNNKKIKMSLATLLGSMMQNDKFIQSAAIDNGIFKILELLNNSDDDQITSKYVYMLTGILYGEYDKSKMLFINEFEGLKLLYNLLIKTSYDSPAFRRILNILKELTKIEDQDAENYHVRQLAISRIAEINLHKLLINILSNVDYDKKDNIDSIRAIFEILNNIVKVFDNLEIVFNCVTEMNNKLNSSKILTSEEVQEEKTFFLEIIKSLKNEFVRKESNNNKELHSNCDNGLSLEPSSNNSMVLVEKDDKKNSMHIQLK